jgi:protein-tyrosine-phosphatase
MKYKKIVIVCTDNTCLSIMAESVMKSIDLPGREIISRGLVVLFPEPVNSKAVTVLKGNQMEPAKEKSEQLTAEDLAGEGVLVLTMTEKGSLDIKERFGGRTEVYSLGTFTRKPGDIVEPHGGTLAEYGACYEYIDLLTKMAAEIISRDGE